MAKIEITQEPYVTDIMERVREAVPEEVPVYHIGVPPESGSPRTFITVSFSSPTWVRRGAGIVSVRKDVHQVMCSVKVDAVTADLAHGLAQQVFWHLVGYRPTNSSEVSSSVSGSWGRVEGHSRPHSFAQAMVFHFNTNLSER